MYVCMCVRTTEYICMYEVGIFINVLHVFILLCIRMYTVYCICTIYVVMNVCSKRTASIYILVYECVYVCMYICTYMYVCMYVCMYVYFNEWRSDRVLVRLGLNTLISWLQAVR